ncbi:MAG: hypothetical protein DSY58_07035 [Desulfobulbus sp.]|nr:MAG: hypothetical protein DSY58_07035 [Desulfobulbus sp.]
MDLALISMPWAIFNRPSIQLGCLKAYLGQELQTCRVTCFHPFLDIAAAIGFDNYRLIAETPWAAEALYCGLLFPKMQKTAGTVFSRTLKRIVTTDYPRLLEILRLQHDQWLEQQDFSQCSLIGFSVCFSQLPASLYAARDIRKKWPGIPIVFGGSTCTPAMGRSLLKIFPEIDFIITGEGERALKELVLHCTSQEPLSCPEIISHHEKTGNIQAAGCGEIVNLDDLPLPDYSDYFQHIRQKNLGFFPVLPVEFSRGCWWNKCTFCNLNLQWHGYRFKHCQQMTAEINELAQKYQCLDFTFTDNALPVKESTLFFEAMAGDRRDIRFFAEIRTLKSRSVYTRYCKGGLNSVQIGIEALSDSLLGRMCKGTTVMDNVAAMKFSQEAGMTLDGNLILEFPGSTAAEVEQTLAALDKVFPFHPLSAAAFFLGHGSPVSCSPEKYGITTITQHPTNKKLYPPEILANLDMLIKSYRGDRTLQTRLWQPVRKKIAVWQEFHARRKDPSVPALSFRDGGSFLLIRQELPDLPTLHHRLKGLSRKIYLACEEPITKKELLEIFTQVTKEQLNTFLAGLEQKNIIFCSGDSCLALAIQSP